MTAEAKREYAQAWYWRNREKIREYQRQYRARDPERYKRLRIASSARYRAKKKASPEVYSRFRERQNAAQQKHKTNLRAEVFAAYGGKCACCGLDNWKFLTIDHVHNNGAYERKVLKHGGGVSKFYRIIKRCGFPPDYQLLCMNCNCAKYWWGICPHQQMN